jgi:hypothetical protein
MKVIGTQQKRENYNASLMSNPLEFALFLLSILLTQPDATKALPTQLLQSTARPRNLPYPPSNLSTNSAQNNPQGGCGDL